MHANLPQSFYERLISEYTQLLAKLTSYFWADLLTSEKVRFLHFSLYETSCTRVAALAYRTTCWLL